MAEWLKAHAWKACGGEQPLAGSNPAPSAIPGGGILRRLTAEPGRNDRRRWLGSQSGNRFIVRRTGQEDADDARGEREKQRSNNQECSHDRTILPLKEDMVSSSSRGCDFGHTIA